jgi:23S rRNA (uracil1939-C5)-methyltransferase
MNAAIQLQLTAMTYGGSALGRHEGRAVFVPYALPDERITAHITRDKGRFAYAELDEVLEASPARVHPPCPHFGPGQCGGCHWQHADYNAQLIWKQHIVADQLARIGGLPDALVLPTIPSAQIWGYRSHISFHVTAAGRLGFVSTDDRTVLPIEVCHIIRPELADLFASLKDRQFAQAERVRVQVGSDGAEQLAAAQINHQPPRILIGSGQVHYTIGGHRFQVSAGSFFQVNLPQTEALVTLVLEKLNLRGGERVLDLYSGVGLFTAFLAQRAAHVTAIESYAPAVHDAQVNLRAFDQVDLLTGAVEKVLAAQRGPFDAAVVDPPRAGMETRALDALLKHAPQTIVYVSCDPSTLARDAKRLTAHGYRLLDAQPVDMFPQTYHIETVAHFTRTS